MAWLTSLTLLLFYLLGLFVFHGPRAVHLLPLLALIVIALDYLLARQSKADH